MEKRKQIIPLALFEFKEGQAGTNMEPAKITWFTKDLTLLPGPELFATGADKINKNSQSYKNLVELLRKEASSNSSDPGKIPYLVIGGASAVKLSASYDNQALAEGRAKNMIAALKEDLGTDYFSKFNFTYKGVVGVQTQKGPEATKEQFVKLKHNSNLTAPTMSVARDATATPIPVPKPVLPGDNPLIPTDTEEREIKETILKNGGSMCFEIGYSPGGMSLTSDNIHIALDKKTRKFTIKKV